MECVNLDTGTRHPISYFNDDTIEVVRQQIGRSLDIHPDRLFILIGIYFDRNYYRSDKRHWAALFNRLSMNGMPIQPEVLTSYCKEYRLPNLNIQFQEIDKETWMTYPEFLRDIFDPSGDFTEYRILGVEEEKSYCLPFDVNTRIANLIPSAQSPLPDNSKLLLSFVEQKYIRGFLAREFQAGQEGAYFPYLRTVTPARLPAVVIRNLEVNHKLITDLLTLTPPHPKETHILRANWYIQLVDTDFGEAIRTRFEQIFYGLTVSEEVPVITYFTRRDEISRHKFYTADTKTKKPFLDTAIWSAWWSKSKPARDRPTLVLYRGKDRENFDRITVTETDIVFAVYRDSAHTETLDSLKQSIKQWFEQFDSVTPFIETTDTAFCRWDLQELRYECDYSDKLDELDLRRMNCLSAVFNVDKRFDNKFRFLRTDYATDGVDSRDLRIFNLMKDNQYVTPRDVADELHISIEEATVLLQSVKSKIEENPRLLDREYRGFPEVIIMPKSIIINSVRELDRPIRYANILRYVLSNPSGKDVDKICPKRLEHVETEVVTIPTQVNVDQFDDLFGYLEQEEEPEVEKKEEKEPKKKGKKSELWRYFYNRLIEYDPETFNPNGSRYPKECEKSYQPVVLTDADIERIKDTDYDPRKYLSENQMLSLEDPNGIVTCPEYWCIRDEIPLRESQLILVDGKEACPVCKGKIRSISDTKSDTSVYTVIKRPSAYSYPGLKDYKSPTSGKNMPCCYKTPRTKKVVKEEKDEKYYVLGETKEVKEFRLAYLPEKLIQSLQLPETYSMIMEFNNRIQSGMTGYFRVGLGNPAVTLPTYLGLQTKLKSPRHAIPVIMRCSFLPSWLQRSEEHVNEILEHLQEYESKEDLARIISSIDKAFEDGTLSPIHSLEYIALLYKVDIFKINLDTLTMSCVFPYLQIKPSTLGIIILQNQNQLDVLAFVERKQRQFQYVVNIFQKPFTEEFAKQIKTLRLSACKTDSPDFFQAIKALELLEIPFEELNAVVDVFGRFQAFYIKDKLFLPFQKTPVMEVKTPTLTFSELTNLPSYSEVRKQLDIISKVNSGYEWAEDGFDIEGNRVELITKSGLRIPVIPEPLEGNANEVLSSVMKESESQLTFGKPNMQDEQTYKQISYFSEVYEFLIYQLTKDIQGDYTALKDVLQPIKPKRSEVAPELETWFNETVLFHSLDKPIEFLSKIRKPCGQLSKNKCESGHMCAWTGKVCKTNISESLGKEKLFNKLLNNLLDNSKLRYMVLDGLTTPFFSTILYLQLPNEVILTDLQLKTETI